MKKVFGDYVLLKKECNKLEQEKSDINEIMRFNEEISLILGVDTRRQALQRIKILEEDN